MFNLLNKENFDLMVRTVWEKVKAAIPANMKGATAETGGAAGMVPRPEAGKQNAFLRGDGTWVTPAANLMGTVPGIPLDQTMGKQLKEEVDALNSNLSELGVKRILAATKAIKLTTGDTPNAGFYSGTVDLGDFPTPFSSTPKVIATMASANGTTLLIGVTGTTSTSWGKAVLISNAKRENMDNTINLVAVQTT